MSHLHHASRSCLDVGLGLLVIGLLSVIMVSVPRLRFFNLSSEIANNFVYFGHLRKWRPDLTRATVSHPAMAARRCSASAVMVGSAVRGWPATSTVTDCKGRSVRTIFLIEVPVCSCR